MERLGSGNSAPRPVSKTAKEYGRGIVGGFLFSLPLLYTMEIWWAGLSAEPWRLMLGLLAGFFILTGYNRYSGLRHDLNWYEVLIDGVEELGLGIILASLLLWLQGQIGLQMHASEIVGKIVIESIAVAIGISIGKKQLGGSGGQDKGEGSQDSGGNQKDQIPFSGTLAVAGLGAVVVAANVAPTEEILPARGLGGLRSGP